MSRERYLELVRAALRRAEPSLVLYMVDLLDLPDNLLPHLPALVGPKQLIVLGNKVDLLPQDTAGYRQRLQERLWDDLLRDMRLISAKTGYGVEELISVLQRSWRYRGAACLVGANNASKTTLCNTLLESDYCIAKGAEAIDRATDSPWPGKSVSLVYSCGFRLLPMHITSLDKADTLYQKRAGHTLLKKPYCNICLGVLTVKQRDLLINRMAGFPPLVAEDITLDEGPGESEAVADTKFSSAGGCKQHLCSALCLHRLGHSNASV
ncbi:Nitric oxide-associated protein 1 [Camelus dromedarius]|uniref:Nitric oxide-associated protein 1 n=1 Tax=Camelus dromedarius TaxID=9838 RepID=A0A5N4EF28_CAMDR|nr:Nitric oxide-associated protein 1 [Camelus dromedarius]